MHWKLADTNNIKQSIERLTTDTELVAAGRKRLLLAHGPPGLGKTETVEAELSRLNARYFKCAPRDYLGIIAALQEADQNQEVVVFDECDYIMRSRRALQTLNEAFNRRPPSWHASRQGPMRVIILTNINLDDPQFITTLSSEVRDNFKAFKSRWAPGCLIDGNVDERCNWAFDLVLSSGLIEKTSNGEAISLVNQALACDFFGRYRWRLNEVSLRSLETIAQELHLYGQEKFLTFFKVFLQPDSSKKPIHNGPRPSERELTEAQTERMLRT